MEEQITYSSSELRSPQTSVEPTSKALLEENEVSLAHFRRLAHRSPANGAAVALPAWRPSTIRYRAYGGREIQKAREKPEKRSIRHEPEPLTSWLSLPTLQEASDYLNEELLSPLCGLCNDLALALVLREGLPECTAALLHKLLPGVVFCAVGLVVEDGHQLLNRVLIQPDSAGLPALALAAESTGSAAWTALKSQAPLVWCRSHEGETRFPEWEKLAVTFGLESVVAVPLQIPGCVPIGCATFAIADCEF